MIILIREFDKVMTMSFDWEFTIEDVVNKCSSEIL